MTGADTTDFTSTMELLAGRWAEAGPLLPAFALLARGRPLEIGEIAAASGVAVDRVSRALDAARCERDADGRLIDLYGLMLTPTLHRLESDGRFLFSCCALWAHVVPKLLGTTLQVESIDPQRRERVRLSLSPAGVESVSPAAATATLATPTRESVESDIYSAFCTQVCHFVSPESAREFAATRENCHVVEISELREASAELHRAIWAKVST